ncbi:hypothetical protein SDC9_169004 [bioreactor metagenome]|uniref:Uncharacterized protein n=1 Tax=bioreactor metagenome TaxID=1076179 RepID=A0A645GC88_9ZZZZ
MVTERFIEIAEAVLNALFTLHRFQMALINKPGAKTEFEFVIIRRDRNDRNNLSGANISHGHHVIAYLRPNSRIFSGLHIASRQRRTDDCREGQQQQKQIFHH